MNLEEFCKENLGIELTFTQKMILRKIAKDLKNQKKVLNKKNLNKELINNILRTYFAFKKGKI